MIKTTNLGNDLFLLMVNLTQVKDRERIVQLFTGAISNIFPELEFSFTTDGEQPNHSVSVATSRRKFDRIKIKGPWDSLSEDVMALIRNAGRMLGLILENRFQEEDLISEKNRLEIAVASRIAELVRLNEDLQKQMRERQNAEKTLQDKTEELEHYFTGSLDLLCIADTDGYFRRLNPEWQKTLGYDLAELEGKKFLDFVHPDDVEKTLDAIARLRAQESVVGFENRYMCRDGSYRWIEWRSYPKGTAIYAVARDITKRKLTEQALRESEERFRLLADGSFEGVMITSDNTILDANRTFCETFGYKLEELTGLDIRNLIAPEFVETTISQRRSGREETYESLFLSRDGRDIPVHLKTKLIPYPEIAARITSVRDISKTIKAQEVQKRLATAIEQAMETVIITDSEGIIQYVNPVSERITGYASKELIGKTPGLMKSGKHDSAFYRELWDTIKSGNTWSGRLINKRKDGSLFHEEATISPVRNASGEITNFVAVKRDITQHLEISKQLFQAQKMEAIATLAGGIAHNFNNLLTIIRGYSEFLLADEPKDSPTEKGLEAILHAATRGADLVKHILAFGKKLDTALRPTNLNNEVQKVRTLLSRTIPKMISLEFDLVDDPWTVNADSSQIEQALLNLVLNSKDAMPEQGGEIVITTNNVILDSEYALTHPGVNPSPYVQMAVSDNGSGIEQEVMDRIFEPFFTTKKQGKGTGLGLAMVFGIVDSHGGHIDCHSIPGNGTTFGLYFPALETGEPVNEQIPVQDVGSGNEMILVVDDERFILDFAGSVLSKAGYNILTASNGKQALEVYTKHPGKVDLVILDLMMPIMGGRECLKELLKIDPNAKIVIATGHARYANDTESGARLEEAVISKPFRVGKLLEIVRKILDT